MAHNPATTHHRDLVGNCHHLAQLVRDEDHGNTGVCETSQDIEQVVGLLGSQHSGWLVQDQDVDLAVEGTKDLDPLLNADREVLDYGLRVDVKSETLR